MGAKRYIPKEIYAKIGELTPKALSRLELELKKDGPNAVRAAIALLAYGLGPPGEPLAAVEQEGAVQLTREELLRLADVYASQSTASN